jgi:hypothetical protein
MNCFEKVVIIQLQLNCNFATHVTCPLTFMAYQYHAPKLNSPNMCLVMGKEHHIFVHITKKYFNQVLNIWLWMCFETIFKNMQTMFPNLMSSLKVDSFS